MWIVRLGLDSEPGQLAALAVIEIDRDGRADADIDAPDFLAVRRQGQSRMTSLDMDSTVFTTPRPLQCRQSS